jgi:hypothetical protein
LKSDSRSKDGDNNSRILDGEQVGHATLDLAILPVPFKFSADKIQEGDNNDDESGIDSNTSPHPAKRQRSISPCSNPNTDTPPLSHSEHVERGRGSSDGSDSGESGDDNNLPKRRKLSDPPGDRNALSSHSGQSQHSSSISEDPEEHRADGSESTARTTPGVFDSASLTKPQLCPEVIDPSEDWEVRKIIGKEYVDGILHYLVEWCPTLEPEHSLGHAKELVDEFKARLQALRNDKEGRMGPAVKRDGHPVVGADVSGGQEKKRQRGRPRKHK